MTRVQLVVWFLVYSFRCRIWPWHFFQLNALYFNRKKGIFSKLDIDKLIPEKWRLFQEKANSQSVPHTFPVFMKPEWGQNSHGIIRADSVEQFQRIYRKVASKKIGYIVQQAAPEALEFEIFYIRSGQTAVKASVLSVTEVFNTCTDDSLPVNGIYNPCSRYADRTEDYSVDEKDKLWEMLSSVGRFRLARVGIRADSKEALLAGKFHIFEINLFLPMPLSLLDRAMTTKKKAQFIRQCMLAAAKAVRTIPREQQYRAIFFRKMLAHYRVKRE